MARKSRSNQAGASISQKKTEFRAGIYARLSVEDGDDQEQNSIGNQKKIGLHFIEQNPDIALVDTYADNGYSGMVYNRPDFNRMFTDLHSGRINCIIVKDVSRLGRHFVMTSEYVERIFPELGVRLVCINDDYDSFSETSDVSALMLPFKMVMNDVYVKDISKKIRSSITAKMNKGEYLPAAGSIPYGYLRNNKAVTFDVDPEPAAVVRRIFEMRANGMNFNAIARQLNDEEVPCPGKLRYIRGITTAPKYEDALWIRGTIRKITNDPVYKGSRIHGRVKRDKVGMEKRRRAEEEWKVIENAHPAIISEELFAKVQRVNQEALAAQSAYGQRNEIFDDMRGVFHGKVFCGDCGSTMSPGKGCARPNAKTSSRAFFDCNHYKYSNHSRCSSHYIRQETLVQTVSDLLNHQLKLAVDMERLIGDLEGSTAVMQHQMRVEQEYTSICMKRKNLEANIDRLLVDLTESVIDRTEYDLLKSQFSRRHEALLEEESKAAANMNALKGVLNAAKEWIGIIKECEQHSSITREILDCLVSKIEVFSDRSIRVTLNYEDPYNTLLEYLNRSGVKKDAV